MTRTNLAPGEKPLFWVGSSKKDFFELPTPVQRSLSYDLGSVQYGSKPLHAKLWKGDGSGVLEIVEDYRSDTFRAVYTVRFAQAVFVLHVF